MTCTHCKQPIKILPATGKYIHQRWTDYYMCGHSAEPAVEVKK